jgi:hypothetical protein
VAPLQVARFHRERERAYAILDPDARNAAFFKLHLDWFREWGLEKLLTDVLKDFPLLPGALALLAIRKARGRHEEGAELFVNADTGRHGVVALRPERFGNAAALARFLRHEFTHLQDMVDPAFGYTPDLRVPGHDAAQLRLARERYRLLWDITIDGRLARAGHASDAARERHHAAFDRAYSFWPEGKRRAVFAELWSSPAPRHARLAELATDPRDLAHAREPLPGAPCPLCGFPAFDWVAPPRLSVDLVARVQREFPHWTPAHGACGRCAEVYEAAARLESWAAALA